MKPEELTLLLAEGEGLSVEFKEKFTPKVANAIVHRDYGFRGTSLMVEIYNDRNEIVNPGRVPDGMTPETLMGVSIRRNEKIADVFARMQIVERLGSGLRRMRDRMRAVGLPPPQIQTGPFFRIALQRPPHPGNSEGVNDLLKIISGAPGLRAPQLANMMKTSPKDIERWLKNLKGQKKIKFTGSSKKGGYWPIP